MNDSQNPKPHTVIQKNLFSLLVGSVRKAKAYPPKITQIRVLCKHFYEFSKQTYFFGQTFEKSAFLISPLCERRILLPSL